MAGASPRHLALTVATALAALANVGARPADAAGPSDTTFGRVVLAAPAQSVPPAETLAAALSLELSRAGVMLVVEARASERLALNELEIEHLAEEEAKAEPGLIAVVGFACGLERCRIVIEHPRSHSCYQIRLDVDPKQPQQTTIALASTLREALLGPLLPELERLSQEAIAAGPPLSVRINQEPLSLANDERPSPRPRSNDVFPWLALQLSYHGAYMGGSTSLLHGPVLGLSMSPRSYFAFALSLGWLGLDRASGTSGTIETHRLATGLSARAVFDMGPAVLFLAPTLRLDSVHAEFFPLGMESSHKSDLDLLGGLEVLWSLPLPLEDLRICLGTGILGAMVTHSYAIGNEIIAPRPGFSVTWNAGLSYGLPWPR